jgi:hypothetical protein
MGTTAVEELLLDAMRRLHAEGRVLYHSDVAREAGVTPDCVAAYKARLARKGLLDPAWSFACPGGRRPASPRPAPRRRAAPPPCVRVETGEPKLDRAGWKRRAQMLMERRLAREAALGLRRRKPRTCASLEEWRAQCGHLIHGA